jgi:hypothetical protein
MVYTLYIHCTLYKYYHSYGVWCLFVCCLVHGAWCPWCMVFGSWYSTFMVRLVVYSVYYACEVNDVVRYRVRKYRYSVQLECWCKSQYAIACLCMVCVVGTVVKHTEYLTRRYIVFRTVV